jgi:hypothetical protein
LRIFQPPERTLKTLHSWLGILILPWILVIGMTGLYLNHWQFVNRVLTRASYDESQFDRWPNPVEQNLEDTILLAQTLWPDSSVRNVEFTNYHDREASTLTAGRTQLIVDLATGHYWVKTQFRRRTYTPDGTLLHAKTYWGALFKSIHEYGWFDRRFGTWLADITASAMVLFGLSGIYLFTAPRLRRRKNRRARMGA